MKNWLILIFSLASLTTWGSPLEDYLRKEIKDSSTFVDVCAGAEYKTIKTANREQITCLNLGKYVNKSAEEIASLQQQELLESYSYDELIRSKATLKQLLSHPEIFKTEYKERIIDKVPEQYRQMVIEMAYVQVMGAAMMALIYALPEDVNNWNKEELKNTPMWQRYKDNIKAGPVIDHDSWAINYIGHPLSGSAYYVWARENNMNWKQAAGVSVFMSTFFWEYGWEALGEVPSIQDLIFTPLIGSIIGEGAYRLKNKIMANGGTLFGSKVLGNIARGFLDPIGELNAHIDKLVKKVAPHTHVKTSLEINSDHFQDPSTMFHEEYRNRSNIGLQIEIKF
jgi:hypothetical protein